MKTSDRGIAALELEEGVVLRAYRDVAGVWTIGAGLTTASGVVRPRAGMVITAAEATNLLQQALREKYEPTVEVAMSRVSYGGVAIERPKPHEFDAGVSFHWNTGAIKSATWVKQWLAKAGSSFVTDGLLKWNKGGGKVLPGLTARRSREAAMLLAGIYRSAPEAAPPSAIYARWGIALTSAEKAAARDALVSLGYQPGPMLDAVLLTAAIAFQRDHALTVDGVIGRATLTTLQRRLNARASAKRASVVVATPIATASLPTGTSTLVDQLLALPHTEAVLIGFGLVHAVLQAIHYRDAVAASPIVPARLAKILRSF